MPRWALKADPRVQLHSVPDHQVPPPLSDWVMDFVMPVGVQIEYVKWDGSAFVEMTQPEKDAVDAAALTASRQGDKDRVDAERLVQALVLTLIDEINILRAAVIPPLAQRTPAQAKAALKAKIDSL